MKNHVRLLFLSLAVTAFLFSCTEKPFKGYDTTENGLMYKIHHAAGDTVRADVGDYVFAQMEYRNEADSIFSSSDGQSMTILVQESAYPADLNGGLMMLGVNDSATFVISTDSFFQKTVGAPIPSYLDSGSYFYVGVKIDSIITAEEVAQMEADRMAVYRDAEPKRIREALETGMINAEPNEQGVYVEYVKKGHGTVVESGKYAKMNLRFGVVGELALQDSWAEQGGEPQYFSVGMGALGVGFESILAALKVGDHVKVLVPSALAFGEQGGRGIAPYSPMFFEVEILGNMTQEEVMDDFRKREKDDRKAYLKTQGMSQTPDADGMFVKELQIGTGVAAANGKKVHVHYTGTFMDGRVFDSSVQKGQPLVFTVGANEVIQGWDKVVSRMKEGDKWSVVIPSELAYGEMGNQAIPPFTTLVFEIELLKVEE